MFKDILHLVETERLFIDDIVDHKDAAIKYAREVLSNPNRIDQEELKSFLTLCLDFYTYNINGEVLIPDSVYDQCMEVYKGYVGQRIVHASAVGGRRWNFIPHKIPGLVGTIDKIYTLEELEKFVGFAKAHEYILAPKFDGVSCSIEVRHGEIVSAATRYDGVKGQDITALVRGASNAKKVASKSKDGYYKCELCVGKSLFDELCKFKKYANRRSATSGIINTPSNLAYARFVDIIPLVYINPDDDEDLVYCAPWQRITMYYKVYDLMEDIESMMQICRSVDFEYRTDGVVIYPINKDSFHINENDVMDSAVAFKCNTAMSITNIKRAYFSIGRMGKAMPMLEVDPVEVNETVVSDVSLGSYDKFLSMGLLEHESVVVYSAGDVIPQVKLPQVRTNYYNAEPIKLKKICPYCGTKLTRVGQEYYCTNEDYCPRVITGKIVNFFDKLGMMGFSDHSFEMIYNYYYYKSVYQYLMITYDELVTIPGIENATASNYIAAVEAIKSKPLPISKVFGAMGISKISETKCRWIFENVELREILKASSKDFRNMRYHLQTIDGVGPKTAETFVEFCEREQSNINDILDVLTVTSDICYKGNVVFTGFRDESLKQDIEELGYNVTDSVTGNTLAVVTSSITRLSTKARKALNRGIPIYPLADVPDLMRLLKQK